MKIAILKEDASEPRVAAIPETIKKYAAFGATVAVEAGAGLAASIADADFEAAGATTGDRAAALKDADIVLVVQGPDADALTGAKPARIVVNTRNNGALPDLPADDIVEIASDISLDTIVPRPIAPLPDAVHGLVRSVKAYERAAIASVLDDRRLVARKAMLIHPAIGEWTPSGDLLDALLGHAGDDGECLCHGPVLR